MTYTRKGCYCHDNTVKDYGIVFRLGTALCPQCCVPRSCLLLDVVDVKGAVHVDFCRLLTLTWNLQNEVPHDCLFTSMTASRRLTLWLTVSL